MTSEKTSLESANTKEEVKNDQKCMITIEIVLGMRCIHLCGFMHRDFKHSNILLINQYEVCIRDFARDDSFETSQSKGVGTLRFMAPGLFAEDDEDDENESKNIVKYTNKVDVYSFGITLIFIIT